MASYLFWDDIEGEVAFQRSCFSSKRHFIEVAFHRALSKVAHSSKTWMTRFDEVAAAFHLLLHSLNLILISSKTCLSMQFFMGNPNLQVACFTKIRCMIWVDEKLPLVLFWYVAHSSNTLCNWLIYLMNEPLLTRFDEKPPLWVFDEKPFWWKAVSMKSCFDEKPLQWKDTWQMLKKHQEGDSGRGQAGWPVDFLVGP